MTPYLPLLWPTCAAVLGLVIGSFITLVSYRLPRGEPIVRGRSRCTHCSVTLDIRDLFPILSWLATHGRCRYCGVRIHWRYPAIELTLGGLFYWLYGRYGLTPEAGMLAGLAVMLVLASVTDFEHTIIPDSVHVILAPLGLLYQWYVHGYEAAALVDPLIAGAVGFLGALALQVGFRVLMRRDGLGFGDVKLMLPTGIWLGEVTLFIPFMFFSGVLGVLTAVFWRLWGPKTRHFPFGPALAAALFVCVTLPDVPRMFWELNARWNPVIHLLGP